MATLRQIDRPEPTEHLSADQDVEQHVDGPSSGEVSLRPAADGQVAHRGESIVQVPLSSDFDLSVFQSEDEFSAEDKGERGLERNAERSADQNTEHGFALSPSDQPLPGSAPSNASLSIADLLENSVRLDWQEAVAIAQQLCRRIARDPAAKIQRSAIEPWNVEITQAGNVEVLPGGTSSDPLVQQVGRVLRSLLHESIAPSELRLIAAQASFDVPVFSSVEELANALRRFERPGETEAIRAAFHRGVEAKFSTDPAEPVNRSVWLGHVVSERRVPAADLDSRPPRKRTTNGSLLRILAAVVGAASLVWFSVRGRPTDAARSDPPVPAMRLSVSTPVLRGQQPMTASSGAIAARAPLPPASKSYAPRPDRLAGVRPSDPNDVRVLAPLRGSGPQSNGGSGASHASARRTHCG